MNRKLTVTEYEHAINALKASRAAGPDEICLQMLKHLPKTALDQIVILVNSCRDLDICLQQWEAATIMPILKKVQHGSDRTSVEKTLEAKINQRLSYICEKLGLLSEFQSAYSPLRSIEDNIIANTQAIAYGFQEKKPPVQTVVTHISVRHSI